MGLSVVGCGLQGMGVWGLCRILCQITEAVTSEGATVS